MSGPLVGARRSLDAAVARRATAERRIDGAWSDAARRAAQHRILTPLDRELALLRAGLDQCDDELAQALRELEG